WDGHGIRVISRAGELADLPASKEPVFAQRYIAPEGPELKMFAIGGRVFGVKRGVQLNARDGRPGGPCAAGAERCHRALRTRSVSVCLASAQTIECPAVGVHRWVYLNGALGLCGSGWRVIGIEGFDLSDKATGRRQRHASDAQQGLATLKRRLEPYGVADAM